MAAGLAVRIRDVFAAPISQAPNPAFESRPPRFDEALLCHLHHENQIGLADQFARYRSRTMPGQIMAAFGHQRNDRLRRALTAAGRHTRGRHADRPFAAPRADSEHGCRHRATAKVAGTDKQKAVDHVQLRFPVDRKRPASLPAANLISASLCIYNY